MDVTLRQLEAFVSVARLGSFTRAAGALHLSQPALTVQIRQLEETLGLRLFDRNTRSVALTQAGRELAPTLERILRELDAVAQDARELSAKRRGSVAIAALPSVCASLLPAVIGSFRAAHPGITIRLRDAVAHRVVALVKAGEVDFGIATPIRPDPEISVSPLFSDRMAALLPRGHPLERSRSVRLEDLARYPLILTDPESSVRNHLDRAFATIGQVAAPAYEVTFMATAIGLVRTGLGIAVLPASTAQDESRLTGLKARDIEHDDLTRRIGIIERVGRSLSPAAEEFVRAVRGACGHPSLAPRPVEGERRTTTDSVSRRRASARQARE